MGQIFANLNAVENFLNTNHPPEYWQLNRRFGFTDIGKAFKNLLKFVSLKYQECACLVSML